MIGVVRQVCGRLVEISRISLSLARANFVLRNEGSYLGLLWYLLSPLATFLVILFVKDQAFAHAGIARYPAYLLVGLLMYHFFTRVAGDSISAISGNAGMIKSVMIPRETFVLSRLFQAIFSHAVEIVALLMLVAGSVVFFPGMAIYLAVLALFSLFCLGVALLFSTLGVYLSDFKNVWSAISHLLFFVSPVFHFPAVGSGLYQANLWNPLSYFFAAGREALIYGRVPPLESWAALAAWAAVALAVGLVAFGSRKKRFAELV